MAVVNTMSVPSKVVEGSFEFGGPYLRLRWCWDRSGARPARRVQVIEQAARGVGFGLDPTVDPREFYRADLGTLRSGVLTGPGLDAVGLLDTPRPGAPSARGLPRFFVRGDNLELDHTVFELASLDTFEALRHLVSAYNHAAAAADGVVTRRASSVMGQDALQQKMQERHALLERDRVLAGTVTGRADCSKPNTSNLPKDAPTPKKVEPRIDVPCNEEECRLVNDHREAKKRGLLSVQEVVEREQRQLGRLQAQLDAARADADRLRGGRTERKVFLRLVPVRGTRKAERLDHLVQIGDNVEHLIVIHDPNCEMPVVDRTGTTTIVRVHTGIECTVLKVER
ncbi:MAG: hypothetical protein KJ648_07570 [Candidatus Omnitrophica bacterium]|nr:hypothetical protein [Candidatus Omnitrophota bacterium]